MFGYLPHPGGRETVHLEAILAVQRGDACVRDAAQRFGEQLVLRGSGR